MPDVPDGVGHPPQGRGPPPEVFLVRGNVGEAGSSLSDVGVTFGQLPDQDKDLEQLQTQLQAQQRASNEAASEARLARAP